MTAGGAGDAGHSRVVSPLCNFIQLQPLAREGRKNTTIMTRKTRKKGRDATSYREAHTREVSECR
jgi:hypothetical protein